VQDRGECRSAGQVGIHIPFLSKTYDKVGVLQGFTSVPIYWDSLIPERATSVDRHHCCSNRRTYRVLSADPLTASLLERKQEEKICIYIIPERGA
jgi:hypothetical protein